MLSKSVRKQRHNPAGRSDQRGQSMAEFALTMPLLLGLLLGIIVLAWAGFSYVSIGSAARMGTRHMMSYPDYPEDPDMFGSDIDAEIIYIMTSSTPFLNWDATEITILPAPGDRKPGTQVSIQIVYNVNNPTINIPYVVREGSMVILPPITLQAISRMRLD